jgi:hypothetical protein
MGEANRDLEPGGWDDAFPDPNPAYNGGNWLAIFSRYLLPDPRLQRVDEHCDQSDPC